MQSTLKLQNQFEKYLSKSLFDPSRRCVAVYFSCFLTIIYSLFSNMFLLRLPFNLINVVVLPPQLPFLSMSFWCLFSLTLHSFASFFGDGKNIMFLACFGLCSFVKLVSPENLARLVETPHTAPFRHNNSIKWTRYRELVQWLYDKLMLKWWSVVKTKCHKSHES